MAATGQVQKVSSMLFRDGEANVYAVLDGASVPGLPQRLIEHEAESFCLFRGRLEPDMREVAPYVVRIRRDTPFSEWLLAEGWGRHWGVFALSGGDLRAMRQHLRGLVTVWGPDGKPLLFRFYDPRVLGQFLSSCNAEQLGEFFGPVTQFAAESDDGAAMVRFRLIDNVLRTESSPLASGWTQRPA